MCPLRALLNNLHAIGDLAATQPDDLSMGLDPTQASVTAVSRRLGDLHPDTLPTPSVAADFAANMGFADCLPPALALEGARQRLVDPDGVRRVLTELNAAFDPVDGSTDG